MITNEDVMKMAKYVGIDVSDGRATKVWVSDLLAFAKFIADLEREACAKVCDARTAEPGWCCADAIRARGEK